MPLTIRERAEALRLLIEKTRKTRDEVDKNFEVHLRKLAEQLVDLQGTCPHPDSRRISLPEGEEGAWRCGDCDYRK